MSGAYFAAIVAKLVVNPSGMDQGIAEGEKKAKNFSERVAGMFKGSGGKTAFSNMFGDLDSELGSIATKLVAFGTHPVGIAAGIAAATVGAAKMIDGFVDAQNEKVLQLEQSAQRIGITRQDRAAFDVLLGPDKGAAFASSLTKFNKLIGEAQGGSNEAIGTLNALGMSVANVAKMSDIQRIEQLAKALNATTSVGQRTKLTIAALGKTGMEQSEALSMIGVMGLGEARKFGAATGYAGTDDAVLSGIEERLRSARSSTAWQGMKNRLAGILEPISNMVDTAQDKMTENAPGAFTALKIAFGLGTSIGGSGDRSRAKDIKKAMEKWAEAQEVADKLGAVDSTMASAARTNATLGMSPNDVALFDFKAKLKDAGIDQTADGMKKLADYTKLLAENADKVNVAKFKQMAVDPLETTAKQFSEAAARFKAGQLTGMEFGRVAGMTLDQMEQGLGIKQKGSVRSTLAGAIDMNTFAGQQQIQQMLNQEYVQGSKDKSIEDRWKEVGDKLADRLKDIEGIARNQLRFFERNHVVIKPIGL